MRGAGGLAPASGPGRYATAASRWAGIGPYYAMFPSVFSDEVVRKFTERGEVVLDPFAGRGTAVYSAVIQGRKARGVEVSPVGYVYSNAKLAGVSQQAVERRLFDLCENARGYRSRIGEGPEFYRWCFGRRSMEFLLAARDSLEWKDDAVDRVLMALALVSLHGRRGESLSNQMRQTTAMSPDYCVRWWKARAMPAPEVDVREFLLKRIRWRYARGKPRAYGDRVRLGDSRAALKKGGSLHRALKGRVKLLLTSPPYHNVTNYYLDQWLRLWLLGGPWLPKAEEGRRYGGKFAGKRGFTELIAEVFGQCASLLREDGVVYVRTGADESTRGATREVLRASFPGRRLRELGTGEAPEWLETAYGRGGSRHRKGGEVDLVLEPR